MNLKNITPVMKGDYTDTHNAYASSTNTDGTSDPWRAFDGTNSRWGTLAGRKTGWIDLLFPSIVTVDYVQIIPKDINASPKHIEIYGSNDRVTYDLIHTVSNVATTDYPLLFKIPRSQYKCFRLNFTESNLNSTSVYSTYFNIQEIYYYEDLDYVGVSEKIKQAVKNTKRGVINFISAVLYKYEVGNTILCATNNDSLTVAQATKKYNDYVTNGNLDDYCFISNSSGTPIVFSFPYKCNLHLFVGDKNFIFAVTDKNKTSIIKSFNNNTTTNGWITVENLEKDKEYAIYLPSSNCAFTAVEWWVEPITTSEKIKSSIKDKILSNKLIQEHIPFLKEE